MDILRDERPVVLLHELLMVDDEVGVEGDEGFGEVGQRDLIPADDPATGLEDPELEDHRGTVEEGDRDIFLMEDLDDIQRDLPLPGEVRNVLPVEQEGQVQIAQGGLIRGSVGAEDPGGNQPLDGLQIDLEVPQVGLDVDRTPDFTPPHRFPATGSYHESPAAGIYSAPLVSLPFRCCYDSGPQPAW